MEFAVGTTYTDKNGRLWTKVENGWTSDRPADDAEKEGLR
jgi:hypothetical protein